MMMAISVFTPRTAFFCKPQQKDKGFLLWFIVFFCVAFSFLMATAVREGISGGSKEELIVNSALLTVTFFLLNIILRPMAKWYWGIDTIVNKLDKHIEQSDKIIALLEKIQENSEQQTRFFNRVTNRNKP